MEELKVVKIDDNNSASYTPRETLQEVIDSIDSGEINPAQIVICMGGCGTLSAGFKNKYECMGFLEYAKDDKKND